MIGFSKPFFIARPYTAFALSALAITVFSSRLRAIHIPLYFYKFLSNLLPCLYFIIKGNIMCQSYPAYSDIIYSKSPKV